MAQKQKTKTIEVVNKEEHQEEKDFKISKDVLKDPRKMLFLQLYFNRESLTFGNAKQSAIRAGFSEEYADNITVLKPKWLSDFIGQQDFVNLAEDHLREVLMLPNVSQAMGAFGPIFKTEVIDIETGEVYKSGSRKGQKKTKKQTIKVPVMVPNVSVIKEKTIAAKIVLPAHDPKYKNNKDPSGKFTFNFNVKAARDKYRTAKVEKITDV